jgi:hypothetical protein
MKGCILMGVTCLMAIATCLYSPDQLMSMLKMIAILEEATLLLYTQRMNRLSSGTYKQTQKRIYG